MPRYFLAIPLPEPTKDRLMAVQPPAVPGILLIGRQELHVTLHFLGEVAAEHGAVVRRALAAVRLDAFTITIRGVGCFPPAGEPQVLWAGVESGPSLLALHRGLGSTLAAALGFEPEERPYSPHVTLARLNNSVPPGVVEAYLKEHSALEVPSVLVNRFALYSSVLLDNVPHYQKEAVFHLAGPP